MVQMTLWSAGEGLRPNVFLAIYADSSAPDRPTRTGVVA